MPKKNQLIKQIFLSLISGFALASMICALSEGIFWLGWARIGVLASLLVFTSIWLWRKLSGGKVLAVLLVTCFIVRILLGVFLALGLPEFGFNNPVQDGGYVFSDAYERDQAAFQVSISGDQWLQNLKEFRASDQYGGLLAFSAFIYSVFSPEVHRPLLIVLLSAFAMTFGLAFLFSAVTRRWGGKVAIAACWVYALYPEGVLLGSSQMREPFLIALACLAFWVCLDWKVRPIKTMILSILIVGVTFVISVPTAGVHLILIAGLIFFDWLSSQSKPGIRRGALAVFLVSMIATGILGWVWLKTNLAYEFYLTESSSGWIAQLLDEVGNRWQVPFLTFYGVSQPLLPAALVYPSKAIWMGIAIFRALGWYLVLPFLAAAVFAVFKAEKPENRSMLVFTYAALIVWILISSLRGGGDQWDNPRYRTIFLPWMSLLVGWLWLRVREGKLPWFWRVAAIEAVFVLVFFNWYLYRYYTLGLNIWYGHMAMIVVASAVLILIGGFVWDRTKKRPAIAGIK
jgi:hypothetical protein